MERTGEVSAEVRGGAGGEGSGDFLRSSLGHDFTAGFAAFGAEVNEVVGLSENIQMVLNYHHGVAGLHQAMKQID